MTTRSTSLSSSEAEINKSETLTISFWEKMKKDMDSALDQENYTLIRSLIESAFALRPKIPSLASTLGGESLEGYGLPRAVSTNNFETREIPAHFRKQELSTYPKSILLTALTNYLVTRAKEGKFDLDIALLKKKYEDIRHQVLMPMCADIDIINESLGIENGYQDNNAEIASKFKANYEMIVKSLGLLKDRKSKIVFDSDGNLEITPITIRQPQPVHKQHLPSYSPVNTVPAVEKKSLMSRIFSNLAKKADSYSFVFGGLGAFIGLAIAGIVIVITGGWATIPFIIGVVFGCMAAGAVVGFGSKVYLNFKAKPQINTDYLFKHANTPTKLFSHFHRKKESVDEEYVSPIEKKSRGRESYTDTPRVPLTMQFVYNKMYVDPQETLGAAAPESASRMAVC